MQTLASDVVQITPSIAQVIAKLALIELPRNEWPELIPTLVGNVQQGLQAGSEGSLCAASALQTMGYICDEVVCSVLVPNSISRCLKFYYPTLIRSLLQ